MDYTLQNIEKGEELIKILANKARESAAFKDQLMKNPITTIEKVTGKELSNLDKKIIVEDQSDNSIIYFNIPARISLDELELTEEQLEMIAGGATPVVGAYIAGVAIGVGVCWLVSKL